MLSNEWVSKVQDEGDVQDGGCPMQDEGGLSFLGHPGYRMSGCPKFDPSRTSSLSRAKSAERVLGAITGVCTAEC
jgi:hypothetical protein